MNTPLLKTTLALTITMSSCWAADVVDHDQNKSAPIDPNTGQKMPVDASSVEQALVNDATKTLDAISGVNTGGLESIYTQMLIDSQRQKNKFDDQNKAHGENNSVGTSFMGGHGNFSTMGVTTISSDSNMATYMSAPEIVHFIGGGPNRVESLNKAMKRGQNWMNKHTCGGFDWGAQFNFLFKAELLKEYLQNLGEGVIAAAPMALLSAYAPQLAEIIKHLKLISSFDLSATKMDCQQMQNALTSGINKTRWAVRYQQCLDDNKTLSQKQAVQVCQDAKNNQGWMENSDGTMTNYINSAAAASSDWGTMARDKMGELLDQDDSTMGQANTATAKQAAAATAAALDASKDPAEAAMNTGFANAENNANARQVHGGMNDGVKSIVRDMFGSFKLTGTGSVEIGNKRIELFNLTLQANAVSLADSMILQLSNHYDQLMAANPDVAVIKQSYNYLTLWTWHARGGETGQMPWVGNPQYANLLKAGTKWVDPDKVKPGIKQKITNGTMDRLSVLLRQVERSAQYKDTEAYNKFISKYDPHAFLNYLTQYEYSLYLHDKYLASLDIVQGNLRKVSASGASNEGAHIQALLAKSVEMETRIREIMIAPAQAGVLEHLADINSYEPWMFYTTTGVRDDTSTVQPTQSGIGIPTP